MGGRYLFLWTATGWVYLAILVDLCTRSMVGWVVSKTCDTALALKALNEAILRRPPDQGLLHPSDRESTYTAKDDQAQLRNMG